MLKTKNMKYESEHKTFNFIDSLINPNHMTTYRTVYDEFIASYKAGTTNAEEVGYVITKMAQFFCDANMATGQADENYNKIFAINMQLEENGKSISAAKAKILTDASDEFNILKSAKITLENIEQLINALKYLQKGMANEYQHMN